ncbi:MAG: hypothetical protein RIA65_02395, partial [Woeseia sp.]
SGVTIDKKANAAFYGSASLTPDQIFASPGNIAPAVANNFVQILSAQTRRLPAQPGMDTGVTERAPNANAPQEPRVRTFGIADPDET